MRDWRVVVLVVGVSLSAFVHICLHLGPFA